MVSNLWQLWSNYDLSRSGAENEFLIRQADPYWFVVLFLKISSVLKQVYAQMKNPRVVAVGACASGSGIFDTYSVFT